MPSTFINIRVGRLPGTIQSLTLNGDRTVATALHTAGLSADGYDIRVQGQPANAGTTLSEGDIVLLVKRIKGNGGYAVVQVGRAPGKGLVEVAVEECTVFAALEAANITVGVDEVVYVNDRQASFGSSVAYGDTVIVRHPLPATTASAAVEPAPTTTSAPAIEPEDDEETDEASDAPDISGVVGTDPAILRDNAEKLVREADELEAGARAALASAAEKKASAAAHMAKAAAIEAAAADMSAATERLEALGVLRPKGEGRWTDIRRLFGL